MAIETTDELRRGDTQIWDIAITDAAGVAFNLTGCTVWFTVRDAASTSDTAAPVLNYWISGGASSGIAVGTPTNGQIVVTMSAAQASTLAVGTVYYADVQVKNGSGVVTTPWFARFRIAPEATTRVTTP